MVQKALRVWLIQSHTPETPIFQEVLKMIADFFKKKDLVDASSPESVTFAYTLNLEFQQILKFEENVF